MANSVHLTTKVQNFLTAKGQIRLFPSVDEIKSLKEAVNWQLKKETDYPTRMTKELAHQYSAGIHVTDQRDIRHPKWEWKETPMLRLDLSSYSYGENIWLKDESANRTGLFKERAGWEGVKPYKYFGESILWQLKEGCLNGNVGEFPIPRMTIISSGNEINAYSDFYLHYHLPPPKVLVDETKFNQNPNFFMNLYADVYSASLSNQLNGPQIMALTNNTYGVNLTSFVGLEPREVFYDWMSYEIFNFNPKDGGSISGIFHSFFNKKKSLIDSVYGPYGSGRLVECLFYHQNKAGDMRLGMRDWRLKANPHSVSMINIIGASPEDSESSADMLVSSCRPFVLFKDAEVDIEGMKSQGRTGPRSGIYGVPEEYIRLAREFLEKPEKDNPAFKTSSNTAAALGLYLQDVDTGKISRDAVVVIINTGIDHTKDAPRPERP